MLAVAVWSMKSAFIHSIVSPTLAVIPAAEKARSLIFTRRTLPAVAGPLLRICSSITAPKQRVPVRIGSALKQFFRHLFSVLLMTV